MAKLRFEQPKNFVRKNSKGMTKKQFKLFKRKLAVDKARTQE